MDENDDAFRAKMGEFVDERLRETAERDALPPGSEELWKSYFRLALYAANELAHNEMDEFQQTQEYLHENAFQLLLAFPRLAKNDRISDIHRGAIAHINERLSTEEFLSKGDYKDLIAIGIVGERLGFWSNGITIPRNAEADDACPEE